jgi:hypothetical protein
MSVPAVITITIGAGPAAHQGSTVSVGAVIAIVGGAVAVAGFVVSALTYWITQRRVRPIVICHEQRKRHIQWEHPGPGSAAFWAASAFLTNESASSAFNVRFGVDMNGNHIPWKHGSQDKEPSRVNVLRPSERHPDKDAVLDVRIDDRMLWDIGGASEGDADEGRKYWAYYQGPAGDWWYTANPHTRSDDLQIRRVRSRRFGPISRGNRRLVKSIERGAQIRSQSISEANVLADEARARREAEKNQAPDDGPDSSDSLPDRNA